jgi:hypothetical protein
VGNLLSPRHVVGLAKRTSAKGLHAFHKVIDVPGIYAAQNPLRVCPAWVSARGGLGSAWLGGPLHTLPESFDHPVIHPL